MHKDKIAPNVLLAMMISNRIQLYQSEVLVKSGLRMSLVYQLAALQYELTKRNILSMSISTLAIEGLYRGYRIRRKELATAFDKLVKQGVLTKDHRPSMRSKRMVFEYGLAPAGKALLREYYEYLGGAHDDKLNF